MPSQANPISMAMLIDSAMFVGNGKVPMGSREEVGKGVERRKDDDQVRV